MINSAVYISKKYDSNYQSIQMISLCLSCFERFRASCLCFIVPKEFYGFGGTRTVFLRYIARAESLLYRKEISSEAFLSLYL